MANAVTGLFQTLVLASTDLSKHLKFSNAMLDCVYIEQSGKAATPGKFTTLNINIPTVSEADVQNIAGGQLAPTDTQHDTVSVPFDQNLSTSFVVKDWDEVRTPERLREKYIAPRMEALLRKANRLLANLVTGTNFDSYTRIDSSGADTFQRVDLATAWYNLANAGVPVEDSDNVFLVTSPLAYKGMIGATEFYQESIVGVEASMKATQRALISPQFNARIRYDQQIPQYAAGTKEGGLFFHRNAIAMATAPLPRSATGAIDETYAYPRPNLPVRIQMQDIINNQGVTIAMNLACGVAVVRKNHGSYLATA